MKSLRLLLPLVALVPGQDGSQQVAPALNYSNLTAVKAKAEGGAELQVTVIRIASDSLELLVEIVNTGTMPVQVPLPHPGQYQLMMTLKQDGVTVTMPQRTHVFFGLVQPNELQELGHGASFGMRFRVSDFDGRKPSDFVSVKAKYVAWIEDGTSTGRAFRLESCDTQLP